MTVFNMLNDAGEAANVFLKDVREKLEPALVALTRTISHSREGISGLPRDYRNFLSSFKDAHDSRRGAQARCAGAAGP